MAGRQAERSERRRDRLLEADRQALLVAAGDEATRVGEQTQLLA